MTTSKPRNLSPKEDIFSESLYTMDLNKKRMGDREFREAITRAKGAVGGVKTNLTQWNRWST